eukprot:10154646-Alexandrium_andersonii.AAC.1
MAALRTGAALRVDWWQFIVFPDTHLEALGPLSEAPRNSPEIPGAPRSSSELSRGLVSSWELRNGALP